MTATCLAVRLPVRSHPQMAIRLRSAASMLPRKAKRYGTMSLVRAAARFSLAMSPTPPMQRRRRKPLQASEIFEVCRQKNLPRAALTTRPAFRALPATLTSMRLLAISRSAPTPLRWLRLCRVSASRWVMDSFPCCRLPRHQAVHSALDLDRAGQPIPSSISMSRRSSTCLAKHLTRA